MKGGSRWELPAKGLLEFDYVTWKRGLEATFKLDLANPCELFIAEQVLPLSPPPVRPAGPIFHFDVVAFFTYVHELDAADACAPLLCPPVVCEDSGRRERGWERGTARLPVG